MDSFVCFLILMKVVYCNVTCNLGGATVLMFDLVVSKQKRWCQFCALVSAKVNNEVFVAQNGPCGTGGHLSTCASWSHGVIAFLFNI